MSSNSQQIKENIEAHNRVATRYERIHGEIFNSIEQDRLRTKLSFAKSSITTNSESKRALDVGCGSGNLTEHLIKLGLYTVSSDVSEEFLKMIERKYEGTGFSETSLLNGEDLSQFEDNSFDMVATYSVLHHIPDYLKMVSEMARVVKPGGIIFIDHENSPDFWNPSENYKAFIQGTKSKIKKYLNLLKPIWYYRFIRLLINPKWQPEGDIHVFEDDHIEWKKILDICEPEFETITIDDYLHYKRDYKLEHYKNYKTKCHDMRLLIIRKKITDTI